MTEFSRMQGDVNDTLDVILSGVADLTGVTSVAAIVRLRLTDTPTVLDGTVIDAAARLVRIDLGGVGGWLSAANQGRWMMQIECKFAGTGRRTFPSKGFDYLTVTQQVGSQP